MEIVVVLLMLSVVGALVAGVVLMGLGGKANAKHANTLMIARVSLQGLTLLALALLFAVGGK
jgi:hypothetical protein